MRKTVGEANARARGLSRALWYWDKAGDTRPTRLGRLIGPLISAAVYGVPVGLVALKLAWEFRRG